MAVWALSFVAASAAFGQVGPGPGARAAGMAGAFVAVADDATAIYWNPAGLASGPFFSVVADWAAHESGLEVDSTNTVPASSGTPWFVGAATLPVGFAYYELESSTADAADASGAGRVTRLRTRQVAATLVQSITGTVTVATSLRFVHGSAADGQASGTASERLDRAGDVAAQGHNAFDLDVGVLAELGPVRLGLVARNLVAPEFSAPSGAVLGLDRAVRVGIAGRPRPGLTLALDADLNQVSQGDAARRDLSMGAEWVAVSDRLAVRGGGRFSTVGDARPVAAGGLSVGLSRGLWIDVHGTRGGSNADRGWGLAGRIGF